MSRVPHRSLLLATLAACQVTLHAVTLHAVPLAAPLLTQVSTQDGSVNAALGLIDDTVARDALRSIIADAAANGLPTSPLVTKLREGVAKHASADRIRSATNLLAQRLATAAGALAPSRSADELAAGADALQVGVPATTLKEMRVIWPAKPLTVPLGVLTEMVSSGVSHANASRRVRELLVKGATAAQIAALGTNVRADIAAGLAPDASMELRSKGVLSLLYQNLPTITGSTLRPPERPRR